MNEGLRMVHLRTVPDAWHAKVLAARLGSEGIVTQLQGNHSGPYPFGAVAVMVEEDQAELAAELLLADEVEAAFAGTAQNAPPFDHMLADGFHAAPPDESDDPLAQLGAQPLSGLSLMTFAGTDLDLGRRRAKTWSPWQRAIAAAAALLVAGGPVLAHFLY
jgi:Putative prokaryotic signal transducing protein